MKHIYLLLLFFLMDFIACKKEDNQGREVNYVSGRLLDAATLEPIEGGTISLWKKGPLYKDTLSAADGSYRMDFEPYEYFYDLSAKADQYFTNKNIGSWPPYYESGRPTGERVAYSNEANYIDIKLPPEGFIKIHMKQVNPFTGNLQFRLSHENIPSGIKVYNGQGLDTTTLARVAAERYSFVNHVLMSDGQVIKYVQDTVFVPRFDTVHYYINF